MKKMAVVTKNVTKQLFQRLYYLFFFILEFNLSMEPSEAFMLSGNKQQHFKIPPGDCYNLNFVLYPLLAGEAVALPLPKLSSLRPVLPHDDVGATLQRLLPSTITGK